ncbi:MAG: glycerol-3-phosphate dehydrogenase/oxidase [Deltaproteobacteria bacterium]|nr:glycerol-3-phosphate dehydrogenase/oxidase [Deltaproteobacteria bacterium]
MWTTGWRDRAFSQFNEQWDLVIIGGGITGAGVLLEASRLGLRALLLEARDFSSGTSSRSTKLVHGGLRYLRQGQVGVTRESVVERERLMKEAKGLIAPLGFCLTSFPSDKMPGWMFGAGLALYDLIALKWQHSKLSRAQLLAKIPLLEGTEIKSSYHYFDAQTDDSRLVLRVLLEAQRHGGVAINHCGVRSLLRDKAGQVVGVVAADLAGSEKTFEIRAKSVVNATGAWADNLRKDVGGEKRLRQIRGSHLLFSKQRLPLREAISLMHPRDGRAVFAIPWEGTTIIGTTDIDHKHDLDVEPWITQGEAEYILEAAIALFPSLELTERDIVSTWSGVRPVINTGAKDPSKESREHALWMENGLLTVTGGKLTTFRIMARDVLEALEPVFGRDLTKKRETIFETPSDETLDSLKRAEFSDDMYNRMIGRHGHDVGAIADLGDESKQFIGDSIATWGELRWAARSEAVVHLDDLLLRRVRIGMFLADGASSVMPQVRAVVQSELGWDDARWEREEVAYRKVWETAYGTRFVSE